MKTVTYTGTTDPESHLGSVRVDDVEFFKGHAVEVEDELAKELVSGSSERLAGFEFVEGEVAAKPPAEPPEPEQEEKSSTPPSKR